MLKHELTLEWQASIAKEISSLTEMGTITHLHTAAALKKLGIDIDEMAPAHTHMVFDNKIKPDAITNQPSHTRQAKVKDGGRWQPRCDEEGRAL